MTTRIKALSSSNPDRKILHELFLESYLQGECYAFAIALHEGLGWPLVGLIKPYDAEFGNDVIWHAGVRAPDGKLHDIRGGSTEAEFSKPFELSPSTLREISLQELYDTRPIAPSSITQARRLAEILWPELHWKDSLISRLAAFTDALEALSRKSRLWIHGSSPTQLPLITEASGDEEGYEVAALAGFGHTITRY